MAIEESRVEETQSGQDRDFALSLNVDENLPSQDVTNLPAMSRLGAESVDWDHVLRATEASTFSDKSCSTVAGPSTHYTLRQKAVLEHLPQLKVECSVCGESVHPHFTVRLVCSDVFCKSCIKSFFHQPRQLRSTNFLAGPANRCIIEFTDHNRMTFFATSWRKSLGETKRGGSQYCDDKSNP